MEFKTIPTLLPNTCQFHSWSKPIVIEINHKHFCKNQSIKPGLNVFEEIYPQIFFTAIHNTQREKKNCIFVLERKNLVLHEPEIT